MKIGTKPSAKSAWRPSWKEVFSSPIHLIAFGGGAGLSPIAPGTVGTLVGIPLWYVLSPLPWPVYFAVLLGMMVFGSWVCGASSRRLGVHDFGGIVFDEILGFLITCIPLLGIMELNEMHEAMGLAIAFVSFRLFDIWKPAPIGWLDRRVHGGFGIMLDDVVAAIYAALLLTLVLVASSDPELWKF